jgi:hypothetical protein
MRAQIIMPPPMSMPPRLPFTCCIACCPSPGSCYRFNIYSFASAATDCALARHNFGLPSPMESASQLGVEAQRHLADCSRVVIFDQAGSVLFANCKVRLRRLHALGHLVGVVKSWEGTEIAPGRCKQPPLPTLGHHAVAHILCIPQVLQGETQQLAASLEGRDAAILRGLRLEGRRYEVWRRSPCSCIPPHACALSGSQTEQSPASANGCVAMRRCTGTTLP